MFDNNFPCQKDHHPTYNRSFSTLHLFQRQSTYKLDSFTTILFCWWPEDTTPKVSPRQKDTGGGLFRARCPWGKLTPRPLYTDSLVAGARFSRYFSPPVGSEWISRDLVLWIMKGETFDSSWRGSSEHLLRGVKVVGGQTSFPGLVLLRMREVRRTRISRTRRLLVVRFIR